MISRRDFVNGAAAATVAMTAAGAGPARGQSPMLRIRRNASKLDSGHKIFKDYALAVKRLHALPADDPRHWRRLAIIHADHCPHGEEDFFHWHRHYLAFFERICAEMLGEPTFALPYWDWSLNGGRIPDALFDMRDLDVGRWKDDGAYDSHMFGAIRTTGRRGLAKGQDLLRLSNTFRPDMLEAMSRLTDFETFRLSIEGSPHNTAHIFVGGGAGHMGDGLSPLDPLFWLHHCNVDRLWAQWQRAGNKTPADLRIYANMFVDEQGSPARVIAESAADFEALGYTYDTVRPSAGQASALVLSQPSEEERAARATALARVEEELSANELKSIGASQTPIVVAGSTSVAIEAPATLDELFQRRAFSAPSALTLPRAAFESRRILARLKGVSRPEAKAVAGVDIFVIGFAAGGASGRAAEDFAGTVCFFGRPMADDGRFDFVVDLTAPLKGQAQEGMASGGDVRLRFQPIDIAGAPAPAGSFTIQSVELVSA
ncbi:MAG: tyrosinase family protein [Amphiplicatus sp.]